MTELTNTWRKTLHQFLASTDSENPLAIPLLMPEYRPDICRAIAHEMGACFFDFRAEVMNGHGMLAHEIRLDELARELVKRASAGAVIAFNIESLLAAKDEDERQQWLHHICNTTFDHFLVLPLAIFQDDVSDLESCLDLREHLFEPQTLISRLAM